MAAITVGFGTRTCSEMGGFAKIYQSIYDGSLREDWQALVTFQQLLILADPEGNVDMTIRAIHHRTGIPERVLTQGIKVLTMPDSRSRTPTDDGRRLALLDAHRDWGWRIINYTFYRAQPDPTNAERKKRWRQGLLNQKGRSPPGGELEGNAYRRVPSASSSASGIGDTGEGKKPPKRELWKIEKDIKSCESMIAEERAKRTVTVVGGIKRESEGPPPEALKVAKSLRESLGKLKAERVTALTNKDQ